jgi:hypothetical protein
VVYMQGAPAYSPMLAGATSPPMYSSPAVPVYGSGDGFNSYPQYPQPTPTAYMVSVSLSLVCVCVCVSQDFYDAQGVVGVAFMIVEKARGRGKEARRCQWYERR